MEFTFRQYKALVGKIRSQGYAITNYEDYGKYEMPCILRHDVDMDLQIAEKFGAFEASEGIKSTYYILLTSELYNLHSKKNIESVRHLLDQGHFVGLHFDEGKYEDELHREEILCGGGHT